MSPKMYLQVNICSIGNCRFVYFINVIIFLGAVFLHAVTTAAAGGHSCVTVANDGWMMS